MWHCANCNESVEDTFDRCWNCGAARDRTVASGVEREGTVSTRSERGDSLQTEVDQVEQEPPVVSASGGMNRREIAALICKTLALLLFAQAAFVSVTGVVLIIVMFIAAPFRGWFDWHEFFVSLILSVPMFATLVVGLVYWTKSRSIASRMVSDDPSPVTNLPITVRDVMIVAFSTAGVFIFVAGLRDFVAIVFFAQQFDYLPSEFWYNAQTWSALVQLALAVWLILGSRGIVRAILWLRTAGDHVPEDEPDESPTA